MIFSELQNEVKRRATRDQGGAQFDQAIKNIINTSLFRIAREAPWKQMRRSETVDTITDYATGSNYGMAALTTSSNVFTIANGRLLTDGIGLERKIKFASSSEYFTIKAISSDTVGILDRVYPSATITATNYSILPQSTYNFPIQSGYRMFMWHEDWGYPYRMNYMTDMRFFQDTYYLTLKDVPTHYHTWEESMVVNQVPTASSLSMSSSNAADTTQTVTIFGKVSNYPDSEVVFLNGTTTVTTSNLFSHVDRVAKNGTTEGRITVTAGGGLVTVSVIPKGSSTLGIMQKKFSIYPLPTRVFPIHVHYYKDPFSLVRDGDIHELGSEFDEAIILLSVSKIKGETEQSGAGSFYQLWVEEMRSLRRVNVDKIDWFPTLESPYGRGNVSVHPHLLYQQIGSNFGPSSGR